LFSSNQSNAISFLTTPTTTSGFVTIYIDGEAITYPEELVITENPSPLFNFSPKVACEGMKVSVTYSGVRFVTSVQVNGQYVPFDPYSVGNLVDGSFIIPEGATSGYVTLTTIDGTYTSRDILEIKPASEVKPIIYTYQYGNESKGYIFKLIGHNFTNTTGVRLDQFQTGFAIQHDDTLLIKAPLNSAEQYLSAQRIVVESPAGQTDFFFASTSAPVQSIISVVPATAKRGSLVTVKLSQKKKYLTYPGSYDAFYFGETYSQRFIEVNDTTYLVEVPMTGNADGKVGIFSFGSHLQYADVNFTVSTDGYCASTGTAPVFPLKKLMIQGDLVSVGNEPYIDNTMSPLEVIPGQPLRLGVTPRNLTSRER
jgi:hypothetical protein